MSNVPDWVDQLNAGKRIVLNEGGPFEANEDVVLYYPQNVGNRKQLRRLDIYNDMLHDDVEGLEHYYDWELITIW
jgi:hypothetical protein